MTSDGERRGREPSSGKRVSPSEKTKGQARRVKVFGIGPDGRKIYTRDEDARAGHRSATNTRDAGSYLGREVHAFTAVSALRNTDTTNWVTFGHAVPPVILSAPIVPAGTHRGEAVLEAILRLRKLDLCDEVIGDPGYFLMRPETFALPLRREGIEFTCRPASYQTKEGARIKQGRVLLGQLFSEHTPEDLANLKLPGRKATTEELAASQAAFNRRAAFRYGRHKAPSKDGTTRWECPFHGGRLRSRELPQTMRKSRDKPLVDLAPGTVECCDGIMTVGAGHLPLMQRTIVGTTAWWEAWGRHNQPESTNSLLQGGFIDLDRGFTRTLNTGRIRGLVAHSFAGLNRLIMRRWKRDQALLKSQAHSEAAALGRRAKPKSRKPRKDRVARYEDLALEAPTSPHGSTIGPEDLDVPTQILPSGSDPPD